MGKHHPCAYWCLDQAMQMGRVLLRALPSPLLRLEAFQQSSGPMRIEKDQVKAWTILSSSSL